MPKTLNIKRKETYKLATELAKLTGESMTDAVTTAVRERLVRVRGGTGLAEKLLRIGREAAARMKEPERSVDHGELFYDEQGLPR